MKCPVCDHEMIKDELGYDCNHCERYFTNDVLELGVFNENSS